MSWDSPNRKHLDFDLTFRSDIDCIEQLPETRRHLQYQVLQGLENAFPSDLPRRKLYKILNSQHWESYFAVFDEEEFHKWGIPRHLKCWMEPSLPTAFKRKRLMFRDRVHGVLLGEILDGDYVLDLPHADIRDDEDLPDWEERNEVLQAIPKEVLRIRHMVTSCYDELQEHVQETLLNHAKVKVSNTGFSYLCSAVPPERIEFFEEQGFEYVPDTFPYGHEGGLYWVAFPPKKWKARWSGEAA